MSLGQDTIVSAPQGSRAERIRSFDPADFPIPQGREEDWRFTPVDRLQPLFAAGPPQGSSELRTELPRGVRAERVSTEQARELGTAPAADRAAAMALARSDGALWIEVPPEADPGDPVRIVLDGDGGPTAFDHVVLTVGHHARVTVTLRHSGSAETAGVLSVLTGDGADVRIVTLQEWDDDAIQVAQHDVLVGRDATVRHIVVTLGGDIVRLSTNVRYAGSGGSFEGLGVYFADAGQHLEHRLFIDHEPPGCSSNVEYKGALQGEGAHAVWVGDVLIRASAEATNTYELNRNLVLTDGTRTDSIPNLEIETGEIVGAGHASATGRFDDEQLFYLQTRGIPADQARRLIVRGFFADIVQRIGVPEISARLMDVIDAELATHGLGTSGDGALETVVAEATQ